MPSNKSNAQAKETKYSPIANGIPSGEGETDDKWKSGDRTDEMATEADTEDNLQNSNETEDLFREEKDEPPPAEKLSPLRRLALLASLLFCVFVIFAFAFLLPCHGVKCKTNCKPHPLTLPSKWTHSINISGIKPVFIEVLGLKREPSKDIVLGYSGELCQDRPGKACSGGLITYRGADGKRLWNLPTNDSVTSMVCRQPRNKSGQLVCIVSVKKSELYRVGIHDGNLEWMGVLSGEIKDFDIVSGLRGDSSSDVVALQHLASGKFGRSLSDQGSEKLTLMSGKSGQVIGSVIPLPQNEISSSVLVTTHGLANQTEFVLFESHSANHLTGSLWAISTRDLYKKTQSMWNASSAMKWGSHSPDPVSGFIQVLPDSVIPLQPVLQDLNLDGIRDIVICRRNMKSKGVQVIALDGVNLQVLWKAFLPASTVDKPLVPSLFDSDEIPDIAVQLNHGNLTSSVVVLSGANGSRVWTLSSSRVLPIAPAGVAPFVSSSGGYLLWLPKSDLKILQESTLNAANSSVNKKENRKRRETSEQQGSQFLQDFEFKLHSSLQSKSDEGRFSQDVVDDISQAVKDSKLQYEDALEDALLGEEPQKDIKRQENYFDNAAQVEEPVSRGFQFSNLHKQMRKDLSNELEELPGSSDGRHKRVAPQKEQKKQFLRAHEKLSQSRGGSVHGTRGRLRDRLPAQQSQKPGVHEGSSSNSFRKSHDGSKHGSLDAVPQSSHDKPTKSPAIIHKDLKDDSPHVESQSGATRDSHGNVPLKSRDIIPQDSLEESTQAPHTSQPILTSNQSLGDGCSGMEFDGSDILVAVFVHRPKGAQVELVKVVEQTSLYLGVEKYRSLFGTSPPGPATCVKFVAHILQRPVLDDLNGNKELQLVYVVSYLEELPSSAHMQTRKRIVRLKMVQV